MKYNFYDKRETSQHLPRESLCLWRIKRSEGGWTWWLSLVSHAIYRLAGHWLPIQFAVVWTETRWQIDSSSVERLAEMQLKGYRLSRNKRDTNRIEAVIDRSSNSRFVQTGIFPWNAHFFGKKTKENISINTRPTFLNNNNNRKQSCSVSYEFFCFIFPFPRLEEIYSIRSRQRRYFRPQGPPCYPPFPLSSVRWNFIPSSVEQLARFEYIVSKRRRRSNRLHPLACMFARTICGGNVNFRARLKSCWKNRGYFVDDNEPNASLVVVVVVSSLHFAVKNRMRRWNASVTRHGWLSIRDVETSTTMGRRENCARRTIADIVRLSI